MDSFLNESVDELVKDFLVVPEEIPERIPGDMFDRTIEEIENKFLLEFRRESIFFQKITSAEYF